MSEHLTVDMTRCNGHGLCAVFVPQLVELDMWGFPVIDDRSLDSSRLRAQSRRAIRACPRQALRLRQR